MKNKVFFDLSGKRRIGTIVRKNTKTIWVKFVTGCNTAVYIQRHITKHRVNFVEG